MENEINKEEKTEKAETFNPAISMDSKKMVETVTKAKETETPKKKTKTTAKKKSSAKAKTTTFNPKTKYPSITALVRTACGDPKFVKGLTNLQIHDKLLPYVKGILPGSRFQPNHVSWHLGQMRKLNLPCAVPLGASSGNSQDPKNRADLDAKIKARQEK